MPHKNLDRKPGAHHAPTRPDVIVELHVDDVSSDKLLDFVIAAMPDRKKTTVKNFLKHSQIKVNDTVTTRFDYPIKTGDTVAINTSRQWQTFHHPRLKIYYEDDDIIVAYKGYGLLSMGTDNKTDGTAYSILRDYVKRVNPANKLFIVHRLDQQTSGLMMFAKSVEAKETMQHNWNNMVLERKYIAVVEGRIEEPEGVISSRLAENSRHEVYSTTNPNEGQLAVTRWRKIRSGKGNTMVEVSLDTGRKNQIRVHMKEIGHPITGDRKYGAATSPIHRLALHAATLRFVHPTTRRDMSFSAPAPASFDKLV